MTPVRAINHIGIAVRSIDAQRPFYEGALGAVFEGVEEVADQKVKVGFLRVGDVRLELLEPTDPSSTVAAFLDKRGEGLHHRLHRRRPGRPDRRTEAVGRADDRRHAPPRRAPHADRVRPPQEFQRRPHRALRAARRPQVGPADLPGGGSREKPPGWPPGDPARGRPELRPMAGTGRWPGHFRAVRAALR
ncbi:MAG: VOC family protein [Singulisphaera sp.]